MNVRVLEQVSEYEFTWYGEILEGHILLIRHQGRTFGQFETDGKVYKIRQIKGNYSAVLQYNPEKLNKATCDIDPLSLNSQEVKAPNTGSASSPGLRVFIK